MKLNGAKMVKGEVFWDMGTPMVVTQVIQAPGQCNDYFWLPLFSTRGILFYIGRKLLPVAEFALRSLIWAFAKSADVVEWVLNCFR